MKAWQQRLDDQRAQEDHRRVRHRAGIVSGLQIGARCRYTPEADTGDRAHAGQLATVVRAPKPSSKTQTARVRFEDGHAATFPVKQLRWERSAVRSVFTPKHTRFPRKPPTGTEGQPSHSEVGETIDYRSLNARDREEINCIAEAIHRRLFVPERPAGRPLVSKAARTWFETAARREGAMPNGGTPSQPKRQPLVGAAEEHGRASVSDAWKVCELLLAGQVDRARTLARTALAHRGVLSVAQRGLDKQARQHTGRHFEHDLLSVRRWFIQEPVTGADNVEALQEGAGPDHFEQWYVRLVVLWDRTGVGLVIGNALELETLTAMNVGQDGWNALCRWILDHSSPTGAARRGRVEDHKQLIFRADGHHATPQLRKFVKDRYPGALRAFQCLQRAMHTTPDLDLDLLPEDRPLPGTHHVNWNDPEVEHG